MSNPIIFHGNGGAEPVINGQVVPFNKGVAFFEIIKNKLFEDTNVYQKFSKPKELEIIIVHNHSEKQIVEKCLEHLGIKDYQLLGQEIQPWNLVERQIVTRKFLEQESKADLVMGLDASDVLVCQDLQLVVDSFLQDFDCDLLFNAEPASYPNTYVGAQHFNQEELKRIEAIEKFELETYTKPFAHLNAGCYIGKRKQLIEYLYKLEELRGYPANHEKLNDDQCSWRELHRRYYPKIQIDSECRIFQSLLLLEHDQVKSDYSMTDQSAKMIYAHCYTKHLLWTKFIRPLADFTRPLRGSLGLRLEQFNKFNIL